MSEADTETQSASGFTSFLAHRPESDAAKLE